MTDDARPALQSLLDQGGLVRLPAGDFMVSAAPTGYRCLTVPAGVTLVGAGIGATTIRMAPGTGPSVRLLEVDGANITISDMTLDGDSANQSVDEHRAGIFVGGATGLVLERLEVCRFTGDGVDLYAGSLMTLRALHCHHNDRDGITLNPWLRLEHVEIAYCQCLANGAQQIDSEPKGTGACVDIDIHHCVLRAAPGNTDFALTIAGSGAGSPSSDWTVSRCTIDGPIQVCWASDIVLARNTGANATGRPSQVYRTASRVTLAGNRLDAAGVILEATGTGSGQAPSVVLSGNALSGAGGVGVLTRGAACVDLIGNTLTRTVPAAPGTAALYARPTNTVDPYQRLSAHGNTASGYEHGVQLGGNGPAQLTALYESGNKWGPLLLDDGQGALQLAVTSSPCTRWPVGSFAVALAGLTVMERTA